MLDFMVYGPRGAGTRGQSRQTYVSPYHDWHLYRKPRGHQFPDEHLARARIDCTDYDGHVRESVHLSAPSRFGRDGLVAQTVATYERLRATYPPGYLFYNNLSATEKADG